MYCSNCGKKLEGKGTFCPYCGAARHEKRDQKAKGSNSRMYLLIGASAVLVIAVVLLIVLVGRLFSGEKLITKVQAQELISAAAPEGASVEISELSQEGDRATAQCVIATPKGYQNFTVEFKKENGKYIPYFPPEMEEFFREDTAPVPPDTEPEPQNTHAERLAQWYATDFDKYGLEIAVLADVTLDGEAELITVVRDPELGAITGEVYGINENGGIYMLEELLGSDSHAGGFFGWYLKKADTGYHLIQETFGMWQGYGELMITEYHLDPKGNRVQDDFAGAVSEGESRISDEAYAQYVAEGSRILEGAYCLYASASELQGALPMDESLILDSPDLAPSDGDAAIVGNWYFYEKMHPDEPDIVSYLIFREDGTANLGVGIYASDFGESFSGTWSVVSTEGNSSVVHLEGEAGFWPLGEEPEVEPYSEDVRLTVEGDQMMIERINTENIYWLDLRWHGRDLDYAAWSGT